MYFANAYKVKKPV